MCDVGVWVQGIRMKALWHYQPASAEGWISTSLLHRDLRHSHRAEVFYVNEWMNKDKNTSIYKEFKRKQRCQTTHTHLKSPNYKLQYFWILFMKVHRNVNYIFLLLFFYSLCVSLVSVPCFLLVQHYRLCIVCMWHSKSNQTTDEKLGME